MITVNHQQVAGGFVYLGTYFFAEGTDGHVEISSQSDVAAAGTFVIADAIRFGNGLGDIDRGGGVSGLPRENEASLYWIEAQAGQGGDPAVVRGGFANDVDANIGAPARWAAAMNREEVGAPADRVYLTFHSNGGGGAARGALGAINGNNTSGAAATPHQAWWARTVAAQVQSDLLATSVPPLEFAWYDRGTNLLYHEPDFEYGEIHNAYIDDKFDAAILEVAFHDNATDAMLLRDPKVRDWAARAAYQATVQYFVQYGGLATSTLLPDAVTNVRAVATDDQKIQVSWQLASGAGAGGGTPTGFRVYASHNGYGFTEVGQVQNALSFTF